MFSNIISQAINIARFPFQIAAQARQDLQQQQENVDRLVHVSTDTDNQSLAMIETWAKDEAAKLNNHGFEFQIRNHDDVEDIIPASVLEAGYKFILGKQLGIKSTLAFMAFGKGYFSKMASLKRQQLLLSLIGKMVSTETAGVEKDTVVIFRDNLIHLWKNVAEEGETIEDIVRLTIRHEFRHAEQVVALRKEGGSQLVMQVQALDAMRPSNEQIMELDAESGQRVGYRPIAEFVKEAFEAIAAH